MFDSIFLSKKSLSILLCFFIFGVHSNSYGTVWGSDIKADPKNRKLVLEAVQQHGDLIKYADVSLRKDREIILKSLKQNGLTLQYADTSLRRDKQIVMAALDQNGLALEFAHPELQDDKEVVRKAMRLNRQTALKFASPRLKKDRAFILSFMSGLGNFANENIAFPIEHADKSLKDDKEFVLKVINRYHGGSSLPYLSDRLRDDKQVVLFALQRGGSLEGAGDRLKNDKEVVTAAMTPVHHPTRKAMYRTPGSSDFMYASDEIKDDEGMVKLAMLKAIGMQISPLKYASKRIKKNKRFIMSVIRLKDFDLRDVDESLTKDKELVLEAVKLGAYQIEYADISLLDDKDVLMAAVKKSGSTTLKVASERFKNDKELVSFAVDESGFYAIKYAGKSILKDKAFVLKQFRKSSNEQAVKDLSPALKKDKEFILNLIQVNPYVFAYLDNELNNDRDLVLTALNLGADILQHAGPVARKDKNIILTSIKKNPNTIAFADKSLLSSKNFILQAIKINPFVFQHLDNKWTSNKEMVKAAISQKTELFAYIDPKLKKNGTFMHELAKINPSIQTHLDKFKNNKGKLSKEILSGFCAGVIMDDSRIKDIYGHNRKTHLLKAMNTILSKTGLSKQEFSNKVFNVYCNGLYSSGRVLRYLIKEYPNHDIFMALAEFGVDMAHPFSDYYDDDNITTLKDFYANKYRRVKAKERSRWGKGLRYMKKKVKACVDLPEGTCTKSYIGWKRPLKSYKK